MQPDLRERSRSEAERIGPVAAPNAGSLPKALRAGRSRIERIRACNPRGERCALHLLHHPPPRRPPGPALENARRISSMAISCSDRFTALGELPESDLAIATYQLLCYHEPAATQSNESL